MIPLTQPSFILNSPCWEKSRRGSLLLRQTPALVLPSSNGLWALSHPRRFPWTDLSHHWKLGLVSAHLVSLHWFCAPPVACSSHPPAVWQLLFPLTQEAAAFLHCWESLDVKSWVWLEGLFQFWQCICAYVPPWLVLECWVCYQPSSWSYYIWLYFAMLKPTNVLFCDKEGTACCGWSCDSATNGCVVVCEAGWARTETQQSPYESASAKLSLCACPEDASPPGGHEYLRLTQQKSRSIFFRNETVQRACLLTDL